VNHCAAWPIAPCSDPIKNTLLHFVKQQKRRFTNEVLESFGVKHFATRIKYVGKAISVRTLGHGRRLPALRKAWGRIRLPSQPMISPRGTPLKSSKTVLTNRIWSASFTMTTPSFNVPRMSSIS
jgi:hypothetical protein